MGRGTANPHLGRVLISEGRRWGELQSFADPATCVMEGTAKRAGRAVCDGGRFHEGAALVLGEVEAFAFGIEKSSNPACH